MRHFRLIKRTKAQCSVLYLYYNINVAFSVGNVLIRNIFIIIFTLWPSVGLSGHITDLFSSSSSLMESIRDFINSVGISKKNILPNIKTGPQSKKKNDRILPSFTLALSYDIRWYGQSLNKIKNVATLNLTKCCSASEDYSTDYFSPNSAYWTKSIEYFNTFTHDSDAAKM